MRLYEMVTQDFLNNLDYDDGETRDVRLRIEKRPSKYDRRKKYIVAMDGDQILREFWPPTKENAIRAEEFLAGYRMAQTVWCPQETLREWDQRYVRQGE